MSLPSAQIASASHMLPKLPRKIFSRSKWFVVVDSREGNQYDNVVLTDSGGKIVFDSTYNLHYLVIKDDKISLIKRDLRR